MAGRLGRVGPYALLEPLGRGGMGEVYLAAARQGDRVALKRLRDPIENDPDARLRLEREVRALRRVESPYVAQVLDADLSGDRPYLVMEYIQGETLLDAVRRGGPLSQANLLDLAQGLASALAIIHAGGVVHRDVKPANVLLAEYGPVLIDFGIAQVLDATRVTMTGTFLGTPGYCAPEVFAGEAVGEPADVHAWAATVAFAATGRPTFAGGTAQSQMYAVLNGKADLVGVPAALLPLVRAALHRDPARRPTAALLADRLTRLARASADPSGRTAGVGHSKPGRGRKAAQSAAQASERRTSAPVRADRRATPGPSADVAEKAASMTTKTTRTPASATPPPVVDAGGAAAPAPATEHPGGDGTAGRRSRAAAPGRRHGSGTPAGKSGEKGATAGAGKGAAATGAKGASVGGANGAAGAGKAPGKALGKGAAGAGKAPGKGAAGAGKAPGKGAAVAGGRGTGAGRKESALAAEAPPDAARREIGVGIPTGNAALLVLALLAVPCVVASVIYPLAAFGFTAVFVTVTRALWTGHWLVRSRRSRRTRGILRVLTFPLTLAGSAVTATVWPGLPAAAAAFVTLWAAAGTRLQPQWWFQEMPVTVAGVAFGIVSGAILGREVERAGAAMPGLRREGLRALAVLGGFVAVCAAAVQIVALFV